MIENSAFIAKRTILQRHFYSITKKKNIVKITLICYNRPKHKSNTFFNAKTYRALSKFLILSLELRPGKLSFCHLVQNQTDYLSGCKGAYYEETTVKDAAKLQRYRF